KANGARSRLEHEQYLCFRPGRLFADIAEESTSSDSIFNTRLVQRPALIVIGVSRSQLNRDVDIVDPLSVPQVAPKQRDLLHSVQVVVVVVDAAHPLKELCQFALGSSSPERTSGRSLCQL